LTFLDETGVLGDASCVVDETICYSPADPHSWGNPSDDAPAVALFFGMPAEY